MNFIYMANTKKEINLSDSMFWDDIHNQHNVPACEVMKFIGKILCSWSGLRSRTPDMQKVIDVFVKNIKKRAGPKLIKK